MKSFHRCNRGFSLIEVLVVITLIVMLLALIMPTLSAAREASRASLCMSKLKQIGIGQEFYIQDYSGFFPLAIYTNTTLSPNVVVWPRTGKPETYLSINPLDQSWSGPFMCPTYTAATFSRSTYDVSPSNLNISYTVNRSVGQYLYDTNAGSFFSSTGTPWMRRPTNARLIISPASKALIIDGTYRNNLQVNYCIDPEGLTLATNELLNRHLTRTNNVLFLDNHVQRADRDELNDRANDWWSLPLVRTVPY